MIASELFNSIHVKGSKFLEQFRRNAVNPHDEKVLKEWGISDVAMMVNRTPQTLRNLESDEKIPKARKVKNGKRLERVYNLQEINYLREYFNERPSKPSNAEPVIIGVSNFKGGSGKSVESLNLAQSLALRGFRVLLIDGDSQGTTTHLAGGFIPDLHIRTSQTMLDVLIGESTTLLPCITQTHWDGLDVIPANLTLYNSEMLIPSQIYRHREETGEMLPFYDRLRMALSEVQENYDVIVIDTPPSLGFITLNVLYAINGLIIPVIPTEADFCSTIQFLNMAQEALARLPQKDYKFVRFLISRYRSHSKQDRTIAAAIRQVFDPYVMTNHMIETEAISKASSDMKTIFEVEPHQNDKRTFKRAIDQADKITDEVVNLLDIAWSEAESANAFSNIIGDREVA